MNIYVYVIQIIFLYKKKCKIFLLENFQKNLLKILFKGKKTKKKKIDLFL